MGSQLLSQNSEAAIWARLMQASNKQDLSAEAAQFLLGVDFEESDRERMMQLAERSEAGTLTAEDQVEFDGYLHVGNLLAVMRSKARLALKKKTQPRHYAGTGISSGRSGKVPGTGASTVIFLRPFIRCLFTSIIS